jgi:hypothetical protein
MIFVKPGVNRRSVGAQRFIRRTGCWTAVGINRSMAQCNNRFVRMRNLPSTSAAEFVFTNNERRPSLHPGKR